MTDEFTSSDYALMCNALIDRMYLYPSGSRNAEVYRNLAEKLLPYFPNHKLHKKLEVKLVMAQTGIEFNPEKAADKN